jgi:UDP-N-acetylmuramate dehydrogenase
LNYATEHNRSDFSPVAPLSRRTVERLDEIRAIARATDSLCCTLPRLQRLNAVAAGDGVAALVYPSSLVGAAQLAQRLEQAGLRWRALGHGPAQESLHDYVAISLRLLDERLVFDGPFVRAHAGYSLPALVRAAAERGLSGLEALAGLSGSVGGALRAQAGLTLRYIWSVVDEVVIADRGGLEIVALAHADERELFDPRDLILAVTLRLLPGEPEAIRAETERCLRARVTAMRQGAGNGAGKQIELVERFGLSRYAGTNGRAMLAGGAPEEGAEGLASLLALVREQVERELRVYLQRELEHARVATTQPRRH